ncbi:MAG: AMP-binding protein, partial [Pseudomonadales bacterium]|nr:AMP-binding protein [Pseudomonadales bacterium]
MKQMTLPQVVVNAADQYGDAIAIQEPHQQFTFNELNALRVKSCQSFIAAGVEKGDRVAIWAPNIAEWVIAAIGLQSAGGILVPINTRMKGREAAFAINHSGAKLLCTVNSFLGVNYPQMLADQDMPLLERVILLPEPEPNRSDTHQASRHVMLWASFLSLAKKISPAVAEHRAASVLPTDIMDIMFTSGTTGQPKAVMCAHGQNIQCFTSWGKLRGIYTGDNCLLLAPFFHSMGYKAGWLAGLIHGMKILPILSFDLTKVLAQIEQDKITILDGAPAVFQSILAHPDRADYDLTSLRSAGTGGAPVPISLVKKMQKELGFEQIGTGYGLTETCGYVTGCGPNDSATIVATTSGRAIPDVEVKCIALDGTPVPVGEPGEICVRGYNLMQGYFNNPAAT